MDDDGIDSRSRARGNTIPPRQWQRMTRAQAVITIVIADDHDIVRHGLRLLLAAETKCEIIAEASDGLEAIRLVERLKPNVLIVDLMMPGLTGLEVTRQITQRTPETRVVVLSMHANEAYVIEALKNGAAGYVLKGSTTTDLVQAVRQAAAGQHYLSPPLSERAIATYTSGGEVSIEDPYDSLTTREREVLHLAAQGQNNPGIAARLFVSPRTIEIHRRNMMGKLGLHTQTDLIRYAIRRGILPPE